MFKKPTLFILLVLFLVALFFNLTKPSHDETTKSSKLSTLNSSNTSSNSNVLSKDEPTKKRTPSAIDKSRITKRQISTTKDFLKTFPGNWKFHKTNNSIHSISGDLFKHPLTDLANVAKKIQPLLAKGNYNLQAAQENNITTDFISSTSFKQTVNGFDIYQGSVSFFSRNKDESIYLINNQLKEVTPFQTELLITALDAELIIKKKFPDWRQQRTTNKPVVFALNGKTSQLAWVFNVTSPKMNQPLPSDNIHSNKEVVISAITGDILHQQEHLITD